MQISCNTHICPTDLSLVIRKPVSSNYVANGCMWTLVCGFGNRFYQYCNYNWENSRTINEFIFCNAYSTRKFLFMIVTGFD